MSTTGGRWRRIAVSLLAVGASLSASAPAGVAAVSSAAAHPADQQVLVFLRNPMRLDTGLQASVSGLLKSLGSRNVEPFHILNAVAATVSQDTVDQLRLNPDVASVQPDRFRTYSLDNGPSLSEEVAATAAQRLLATAGAGAPIPPTSGPQATAPCGNILDATPGSPLFSPLCTHEANDVTHATDANAAGYDGTGVTVADIDTGFDVTHPNLNVRVNPPGPTFRDQANFNENTPGVGPVNTITDFVGHGTATASQIIAQGTIIPGVNPLCVVANTSAPAPLPILDPSGTSNYCIYYKGMAPGATLIPIEALGAVPGGLIVGGTDGNLVRAIQWAVDHGADLINESFSGITPIIDPYDPLGLANSAAVAHGVAVFSAMGNDGPGAGTISEGAINPDVISVGAESLYRAFYANNFISSLPNGYVSQNVKDWTSRPAGLTVEAKPDIVAPGAFGWANFPMATAVAPLGEGAILGSFGGTSQATPVSVGNAALVIQAYKQKFGQKPSPQMLKALLKATATDLGYSSQYQGAGALNSMRAIDVINGKASAVLASPTDVALSGLPGQATTAPLTLTNFSPTAQTVSLAGTQEITIASVTGSGTMTGSTATDATGRPSLQLDPAGKLVPESNTANFAIPAAVAAQGPELMRVWINYRDDTNCTALRIRAYNNAGQWIGYGQGAGDSAAFGQKPALQPGETLAIGHHTELTWNLSKSTPTVTGAGSPEGTAAGPFQILVYGRNVSQSPGGANTACGSRNPASVPITWRVDWVKRGPWSAVTPPASITLPAGGTQAVSVPVVIPGASGTAYGNIAVSTGTGQSQVPVQLRIKVPIVNGAGTFSGALVGSEKEYFGGEWYYHQFDVPAGTAAVDTWLSWPDKHNQVFGYLISPDGQLVVSKYSSLPDDTPLITGNSTRGVHMTQADPRPGLWTVVVYGYGFYGGALSEPYYGYINLSPVAPTTLSVQGKAGQTVTAAIPVHNTGGADFYVQALGEKPGFHDVKVATISGQLPSPAFLASNQSLVQFVQGPFTVPPDAQSIHATATSSGDAIELDLIAPDISYWASGGGSRKTSANSGATGYATTAVSPVVDFASPSTGTWTYNIAYASPGDFTPATITGEVHVQAPNTWDWVKPIASAQNAAASTCSTSAGSGAFNANCGHSQSFGDVPHIVAGSSGTVSVPIAIPSGTSDGIYSGTLALYTVDGDLLAHVVTTVCVNVNCPLAVTVTPPIPNTAAQRGVTGGAALLVIASLAGVSIGARRRRSAVTR